MSSCVSKGRAWISLWLHFLCTHISASVQTQSQEASCEGWGVPKSCLCSAITSCQPTFQMPIHECRKLAVGSGGHLNTAEAQKEQSLLSLPWIAQCVPLEPCKLCLWAAEASWGDLVESFHEDGDEATQFWSWDSNGQPAVCRMWGSNICHRKEGAQGKCKGNPSSTKGLGHAQSLLLERAQEHKC